MDYLSHALLVPTWEDDPGLNFTATTTGAAETVTITRMTVNQPTLISWGDGTSEILPASSEAAINHVYAVAGTYRVRVHRAQNITGIQIESAELGGLNTAELRRSPITHFHLTLATGCTVRSADMAAWRPVIWLLYSMPAGEYNIDSSDMAAWRPVTWYLYSMPAGTYNIDSSDMAEWRPMYWFLHSMPAGEYNIDSADMAAWRPEYWRLYSMPAGTYNIDSSDMAAWRPVTWYLYSMPAGEYAITGTEFAAWTTIVNLRCYSLDPAVPTATVDAWINAIWAARHSYSYASNIRLGIGGTNGPPTGTVQNTCPPTTPAEKLYNLRYAQCAGDTHNIWSPITYTGGSL